LSAASSIISPGIAKPQDTTPDPILIGALRKAHAMISRDSTGMPTIETAPTSPYERRLLRLAFLAPDIQQAILVGGQPRGFNLAAFMTMEMPLAWAEQRQALGWTVRAVAAC
jgi:site-specific DNA recombinase